MQSIKKRILESCLLFIFLAFAGNVFYAQTVDKAFDKQIDQLFSNYHQTTPGVAVAVVKDGKIIFKKGYGAANLEYDLPITTRTVFQIASVSKQFTAFAVYLLEKQRKISLEDDVRKYLPELPDFGKIVRIKHLLAHTSGIKDQAAFLALAGWRGGDVVTNEDVLRFLSRQKKLNFEPGTQFLYSNSGYTLAAEIVRRASGESFGEFTNKYIFKPLGMSDTRFYEDYERIIKNRADSYELKNGAYKKISSNNSADGASNLHTTVEDFAKWVANFDNPKVGDAELIKKFNEPSFLNDGNPVVWGISDGEPGYHAKGQIHWNYRGVRLLSHGGHAAAFRSFIGRFPDKRLAIIALSNDEHYQNFDTSIKIAEFYLKGDLKPISVANPSPPRPNTAEKTNADLQSFEGKFYNEELDAAYVVKAVNGKLFLSHVRHGEIELNDTGKDKFTGRIGFPTTFEFVRDADGLLNGFQASNFGAKNVRFDKVK